MFAAYIKSTRVALIKKGFRNFCDETTFHGFSPLLHAKTWFWTIAWALVLVFGNCIGVYHMYKSSLQFMSEKSATEIRPLKNGEMFYPTLSICYMHSVYWLDWNKTSALNISDENVYYALSFMQTVLSPIQIDANQAKRNLVKKMSEMNITKISDFLKLLSKQFPLVDDQFGGHVNLALNLFDHKELLFKNNEPCLCYIMQASKIEAYLKENQTNVGKSFQTLGNVLNFSIQKFGYKDLGHLSEEEYNFYMGIWFMKHTSFWITDKKDFEKNYTSFVLPLYLYVDVTSEIRVDINTENTAYYIYVGASPYRYLNKAENPCVANKVSSYLDNKCEEQCFVQFQKGMYLCLGIYEAVISGEDFVTKVCQYQIRQVSRFNQTIYNYTDLSIVRRDRSGRNETKLHEQLNRCKSECISACEQWKFGSGAASETSPASIANIIFSNQTNVYVIYPKENDILIMIEVEIKTWEEFIAGVGGLLGIWTGASLISFLEMFYLCCCADDDCCNRRRIKMHNQNVLPTTSKIVNERL